MNDKLKSIMLLKALNLDDALKRDILAKVDFNKEPNEVYENTKTAVQDICGEKFSSKNNTQSQQDIYIVKP